MAPIGLALAASIFLGGSDFIAGLKARTLPLIVVLAVSQVPGLVLMAIVVALRNSAPPGTHDLLLAVAAGLCGGIGISALYRGLAVGSMGLVAPVAAGQAAIPLAAGIATGEHLEMDQLTGIVLAIIGTVLASRPLVTERARGQRLASGIGFALLAALGGGGVLLAIGHSSSGDAYWSVLLYRMTTCTVFVSVLLIVGQELPDLKSHIIALSTVGILEVTATLFYAIATTQGSLALVAVLDSLFPVTTMVLARLTLGERLTVMHRVGSVIVMAGVVLISASGVSSG